jgi:hypothetical protein
VKEYLQSTAPLPKQFRHTGLSFPSMAIAFGIEMEVAEVPIKTKVEHKQERHWRLDVDN